MVISCLRSFRFNLLKVGILSFLLQISFTVIPYHAGTAAALQTSPVISIDSVSHLEGNNGTTDFVFSVSLSEVSSVPVTVDYATADGTATVANNDYVAVPTTTLTFDPGQPLTQMLVVAVKGDFVIEPDETFSVELSNPTNAALATAQGVGTILNDDGWPAISISDTALYEGDNGATGFVFDVSLSGVTTQPVTIDYATADGTASVSDNDYVPIVTNTLTFDPGGALVRTITVNVTGDLVDEPDETFFVNLSNPTRATIADGQGVGTIRNDDAPPQTFTVTSADDVDDGVCALAPGHCSLREAINATNARFPTADTIVFDVTGTISLTATLPYIIDDLTIIGPGPQNLIIDGAGSAGRIMVVNGVTASISGVTFQNGDGALASSRATLTVDDCIFTDNHGSYGSLGGAIKAVGSVMAISNSTFNQNSAHRGGAVYSENGGELLITNSILVENWTYQNGVGGAVSTAVPTIISYSTLSNNTGDNLGGAIYFEAYQSILTLTHSTLSGNTAQVGGGLFGVARAIISNSTFSGNSPSAIYTLGQTTIANSTIVYNENGIQAPATIQSSIVAYNTGNDCSASVVDGGYNLEHPVNQCGFSDNAIIADPHLAPLQDYGGLTKTHALYSDSPAIDAVPVVDCTVTTDQRDVLRPQGGACDIGAFEWDYQPLPAPSDLQVTGWSTSTIDLSWTDNSIDETAFLIERSPDGVSDWVEVGLTLPDATSYSDSGLSCDTPYFYRVRAYRSNDAYYSPYSNTANATTDPCSLPAPSDLQITGWSASTIDLSWTDNSSDETAFRVERSPDGVASWAEVGSTPPNTVNFSDSGLACGTPYFYRVRAYRSSDAYYSNYSNTASATTDPCPIVPNDDIADAWSISEAVYTNTQDTTGATTAPDDPVFTCRTGQRFNTVWYAWTPVQEGTVAFDTFGSEYDTVLAVWTGPRGNLTSVGCNDDTDDTLQSQVVITASAGTTYWIEIAGYDDLDYGSLVLSAKFTLGEDNLVENPEFSAGTSEWDFWGEIQFEVTPEEVLSFYREAPSANGAAVTQTIDYLVPENSSFEMTLELGNVSAVPKEVWVTLRSPDWGDYFACHFTMPGNTPLATFNLAGHASTFWPSLFLEIIPGPADGIPAIVMDNVSLVHRTDLYATPTQCIAADVPPGPQLVLNPDFSQDLQHWSLWGSVAYVQPMDGQLHFYHSGGTVSGAAVFQDLNYTALVDTPFEVKLDLGNESAVTKDVWVTLRNPDWSDYFACHFMLPPNAPSQSYIMRGHSQSSWSGMRLEIVPGPADNIPAIVVDNVTVHHRPDLSLAEIDCVRAEPLADTELVRNGDFNEGEAEWGFWGDAGHEITPTGRLALFDIHPNAGSSAVAYQDLDVQADPGMPFEIVADLGNTSAENKLFAITLRNADWSDYFTCFFMLPPHKAPVQHVIRGMTAASWSNMRLEFWTIRPDMPALLIDNVSTKYQPTLSIVEMECLAPGDGSGSNSLDTLVPLSEATLEPDFAATTVQVIESDNTRVAQTGAWTAHATELASGGGYLFSSGSVEDTLALTFSGSQLNVVYVQHPALGVFAVEVDGAVLQTVDSMAEDAVFGASVTVSELVEGEHVVRIVPVSGTIAIDAFVVEAQPEIPVEPTPAPTEIIPTETPLPTATSLPTATPESVEELETIESDDARVVQSGLWTLTPGDLASGGTTMVSSGSVDDTLTLAFTGPRLDVIYVKHPALGVFTIEIDGAVLYTVNSASEQNEFGAVVSLNGLGEGMHALRIVPVSGTVAIDAFVVEPQGEVPPVAPTVQPTVEPTMEPTVAPTEVVPTQEPTVEPTAEPTVEPAPELSPTPELPGPPVATPVGPSRPGVGS